MEAGRHKYHRCYKFNLQLTNTGSGDAGNYDVVVSNAACTAASSGIAVAAVTSAVNIPYSEDFESITVPNQLPNCLTSTNIGTKTFTRINGPKPHSGTKYGAWGSGADDWFFLPGTNLVAGVPYEFSYWYNTDNTSAFTNMQGAVATEPSAAFITTSGPSLSGGGLGTINTYHEYIMVYTPVVSGVYFFGAHVSTNPGALADKITIDDIGMQFECNGKPTAGTASASASLACAGSTINLSLSGYTTGFGGIAFQWQSSPSGIGTWSNISGANTAAFLQ